MQEMLDIYRDDLQKAGILSRNEAHRTGALHAVCHLWVIDSSRSIVYLQQRSSQKESHPNDYDISCAGHMDPYETPVQTILREAREEIGLCLRPEDLQFLGTCIENFSLDREIAYVFMTDLKQPRFELGEEVQRIVGVDMDAFLAGEYVDENGDTVPAKDLCGHDLSIIKRALLQLHILACENELCIRKARPYDAPMLCEWWNDGRIMAHAGFPNGIHTTIQEVKDGLKGPSTRCIILAGYIPIGEMSYREVDPETVEIGIKIVDPIHQNHGYGTRLLKMFCTYLFQSYQKIILDTSADNERARHVYTKLGFQMVGSRPNAFQDELGHTYTLVDYVLDQAHFKK
ncbi:Bifunctional AAC/APH [Clostridiales bacterium CHKCI006]|nr:Bifunctional AAC/APH [Clostridiales bacterium CHKCI006]